MKKFFLFVFFIGMILMGCSSEESVEEIEEFNQENTLININTSSTPQIGAVSLCNPRWIAPEANFIEEGEIVHITYNSGLSLEEIHCLRQRFFNDYTCLKMYFLQPSDPYHDIWLATPFGCANNTNGTTTAQTIKNAADNNSTTCAAPPDHCVDSGS